MTRNLEVRAAALGGGLLALAMAAAAAPQSPRLPIPTTSPLLPAPPMLTLPNWGFERGLAKWTATGTAFAAQPTFGDNVTAARVTASSMVLGGDYWRNVGYPIGHKGHFWVGTYERRPRAGDPIATQGDGPLGTLTSDPFVVNSRYVTFLVGGGNNLASLKVELLERVATPGTGTVAYPDGSYRPVAGTARTGLNTEVLRRDWWDVTRLSGRTARIRVVDALSAPWGHINVDDFTFQDYPPNAVPVEGADLPGSTVVLDGGVWRDRDAPIWGIADMHTHPASHLAFGTHVFSGAIDGDINQALKHCTCDHGDPLNFQCGPFGESDKFRAELVGQIEGDLNKDMAAPLRQGYHFRGYENSPNAFINWPAFYNVTHQQMWWEWLRRAHQGGLRVIVALAHHNQLVGRVGNGTPTSKMDDKDSLERQIAEINAFVGRHRDFLQIALTPNDLRSIVRNGKLAVVLGSEIDNIGNFYAPYGTPAGTLYHPGPTPAQVRDELRRLHGLGIRYIFPVHLSDNAFGGTGVYSIGFNQANKFYSGRPWSLESAPASDGIAFRDTGFGVNPLHLLSGATLIARGISPDIAPLGSNYPDYTGIPGGHRNVLGLTPLGESAVRDMMRLGMMIDIDHMSTKAADRTLAIARAVEGGYPINSGHNVARRLSWVPNEKERSDAQLDAISQLGGMVGVGWGCGDSRSFRDLVPAPLGSTSRIDNTAAGSSRTFAQSYLYALERMENATVAMGTDINSFVVMPAPRFGHYANYCLGADRRGRREAWNAAQGARVNYQGRPAEGVGAPLLMSQTGTKAWNVNTDGVAHYGLLPDFLQDLSNVGLAPADLSPLFLSAENFARMWERSVLGAGRVR